MLYIGELERRRNQISNQRALTGMGLEILDSKLLRYREAMEKGAFRDAEPMPLLVAPAALDDKSDTAAAVTIKRGDRKSVV